MSDCYFVLSSCMSGIPDIQLILPHLSRCERCRLYLSKIDASGKFTVLLSRAEDWAARRKSGKQAAIEAVKQLHAQGISAVYMRHDGVVVQELPDGTVQPYAVREND